MSELEDFKQYHHNPIVADLNRQLAAERKARISEQERSNIFERALDAERGKVSLLGETRIAVDQAELLSLREKAKDLEQQLADEREKRRIDLEHILDLERQLTAFNCGRTEGKR